MTILFQMPPSFRLQYPKTDYFAIFNIQRDILMRITNYRAFIIHALFLSLTMSFIDVNTVAPAMLTESGATTFHLGLLTAIMVGFASFMQLLGAIFIMGLHRKKPALLGGIYLRVAALASLGIFLRNQGEPATWKIWFILLLITVFSFSGA